MKQAIVDIDQSVEGGKGSQTKPGAPEALRT